MAEIKYREIYKVYGKDTEAVKGFNLHVGEGEFIVIVGPSGCGKSTVLRMTAGLEKVTKGKIYLNNKDITNTEPKKRDIAMVFQNYALYENMTVYNNLAFPLKIRRMKKHDIDERVKKTAEMLKIMDLLNRKPSELSGGESQRTAIGRAIIREPEAFLMDEPLSNLDAKLRIRLRYELKALHSKLGITTIYVTHDKSEAMFLADRIVVMRDGEIIQVGTPDEIYRKPIDFFVADFFEDYGLNRYVSSDGEYLIRAEDIDIKADTEAEGITSSGEEIFLSGNISSKEFMGSKIIWHVTCGDKMYIVAGKSDIEAFAPGDTVSLVMKEKNFLRI